MRIEYPTILFFTGYPRSATTTGSMCVGRSRAAVELLRKMQLVGVWQDEIMFSACTDLSAIELVRWLESHIEKKKEVIHKSVEICDVIIDMFANKVDNIKLSYLSK